MLDRMDLHPLTQLTSLNPPLAIAAGLGMSSVAGSLSRFDFPFLDPVNIVKFQPGFSFK
jgi:hypothetical protein